MLRKADNFLPGIFLFFFLFIVFQTISAAQISYANITVFAAEKDLSFAEIISRQLAADIGEFQMKIGLYPEIPVKIYVASGKKEYTEWTRKSFKIIEFSEAFFDNRSKAIFIRNPRNLRISGQFRSVVLHEYIHLFVSYFWKNPPLWFNEGMAVYFSREFNIQREYYFVRDYIFGKSMPLWQMESHYPIHRSEWQSFYAKSAFAVKYLYTNRRKEFFKLWDIALPKRDFHLAFGKSFLMTTRGFSNIFEDYCRHQFKAEILLASSSLIWGLMPFIFIIAFIGKQKKMQLIYQHWQDEENNEDTERE